MKIKGFIISGIVLCAIGGGLMVAGATRDDFRSETIETKELEYENIYDKIVYECKYDNIEVNYGDVSAITIISKFSDSMSYDVTMENSTIYIKQQFQNQFWNNLFAGPWYDKVAPFSITIPQDTLIDLSLKISAGNVSIEDMSFKALDMDISAGGVVLSNIKCDSLNVKDSAGTVEVENSVITDMKIKNSCGSVECGNVTVNTLDLDVSAGSINYSGLINKKATLDVSAGSINMDLNQDEELFTVNGKGDGAIIISYSCSAGSVNIDYKD